MKVSDVGPEIDKVDEALTTAVSAIRGMLGRRMHIAIINKSTVLSDDLAAQYVAAIQKQVNNEFAAAWGCVCELHFVPIGLSADPAHWWIALMDDSTMAGALGYHDLNPAGLPIGYVFCKTDLQSGSSISVTLSHEVTEMLLDPYCSYCVQLDQNSFVALECGDPVEADSDGYPIDGVQVSNFVLPAYFEVGSPGPFDYMGLLKAPMPSLRPDGYVSIWTAGTGWGQRNGATIAGGSVKARAKARPYGGSRRMRRTIPRAQWLRSEPKA